MSAKRLLLAVAVLLVLIVPSRATATVGPDLSALGTNVAGLLMGANHWTADSSPYTLTDNLALASGATLVIDPGVTVISAPGLGFTVAGVVTANGTPTDPITFVGGAGLRFQTGSAGSAFTWVEFRQTSWLSPADSSPGELPFLSHVLFNGGYGMAIDYPNGVQAPSTVYTFSDLRFTNGAALWGCCGPWSASRISIENSMVADVLSYSLAISITDSNILRRGTGVCTEWGDNCAVRTYAANRPVSASGVWWGTTDIPTINSMIYDGLDNPSHVVVALDPIRIAPIDLVGPTSTLSSAWAEPTGGLIAGTAADDSLGNSGVASVTVSLRDTVTGDWWSGSAWTAAEAFLPASGTDVWSLSLPALLNARTYAVRVHAVDNAGNPQWGTTTGSITADGSAPSGTVTINDGASITTSAVLSVAIPATDAESAVTSYRVSTDGATWSTRTYAGTPVNVSLTDMSIGGSSTQGERTVWVAWRDAAGHWSAPASDSIVFDNEPPTGTVVFSGGSSTVYSLMVPVHVEATDSGSGVDNAYLSNNGWMWVAHPPLGEDYLWDLSANGGSAGDGSHCVSYKLVDNAGNVSTPATVCVTVDTSPPTAQFTAPDSPTKAATVNFGLRFDGPVNGLDAAAFELAGSAAGCTIGDPTGAGSEYTVPVTGCSDGTVTLTLKARSVADAGGILGPSAKVASAAVTIDRSAPTATLACTPNGGATTQTSIPCTVTFSEIPGLSTAFSAGDVLIGGTATGWTASAPAGSGTGPYTFTLTGTGVDGTLTVAVAVGAITDATGNPTTASGTVSVVIDRKAPTVAAPKIAIRSGAGLSGTAIPVTVQLGGGDGAGSGIDHWIVARSTNGGRTWTTVSSAAPAAYATSAASSGTVRFRSRSVDKAGNTSGWSTASPAFTPRLTQQASATYVKTWKSTSSKLYSGGSEKYTVTKSATATLRFTGRSIGLVATLGAGRGQVRIYINNRYVATVDLNAATTQYRAVAWSQTWSSSATRTIKLVVVGTAGRPRVDLDAFAVIK